MLYTFTNEGQYSDPTEISDLEIYNKVRKATANGKPNEFELLSSNDSRIFRASSQGEMKDWMKHLKLAQNYKQENQTKNTKSHHNV